MELKIEQQAEFVKWWRGNVTVHPSGNNAQRSALTAWSQQKRQGGALPFAAKDARLLLAFPFVSYFFGAGHFTVLPSTVTSSPGCLPLQASATGSGFCAKATGVSDVTAKVAATRADRSLVMMFPLWG